MVWDAKRFKLKMRYVRVRRRVRRAGRGRSAAFIRPCSGPVDTLRCLPGKGEPLAPLSIVDARKAPAPPDGHGPSGRHAAAPFLPCLPSLPQRAFIRGGYGRRGSSVPEGKRSLYGGLVLSFAMICRAYVDRLWWRTSLHARRVAGGRTGRGVPAQSSSTRKGSPGASRTMPSTTTRSPSLSSPSTTLVPSCSKRTRTLRNTAVSSGPAR